MKPMLDNETGARIPGVSFAAYRLHTDTNSLVLRTRAKQGHTHDDARPTTHRESRRNRQAFSHPAPYGTTKHNTPRNPRSSSMRRSTVLTSVRPWVAPRCVLPASVSCVTSATVQLKTQSMKAKKPRQRGRARGWRGRAARAPCAAPSRLHHHSTRRAIS